MGSHRVRHDLSDLAAAAGLQTPNSNFALKNPIKINKFIFKKKKKKDRKKNLTAPIPDSKGTYIISCGHRDKIAENPNQRHSK